jgi:hypothetical protein
VIVAVIAVWMMQMSVDESRALPAQERGHENTDSTEASKRRLSFSMQLVQKIIAPGTT